MLIEAKKARLNGGVEGGEETFIELPGEAGATSKRG